MINTELFFSENFFIAIGRFCGCGIQRLRRLDNSPVEIMIGVF